jgi:nitroimidazol reductase NimA-like FMN-containing flavoprotein (pyridoxamine 5'-phosphate oxidase superfamily)
VSFLSTAVQGVLDQGPFCAVATSTPRGPHCTPLVFAASAGRLWLTTSRRSVKARAWKVDPSVAGLVRHGDMAVTFTGTVKTYDALDRGTWGAAVAGATSIARATAGFSRKNARFFAGYALDAKQVPFAWTPPGRVFVGIDLERTALLDRDGVQEGRGRWAGEAGSHPTFRRSSQGIDVLVRLPAEVGERIGREGDAVLTLVGARGPVVLPVRWRAEAHALYAALPSDTLALAGAEPDAPAALTIDVASVWRARDMVGALFQGSASCFVGDRLGSGAKTARSLAASIHPGADALVRLQASRVVWWKGWSSGNAEVAAR